MQQEIGATLIYAVADIHGFSDRLKMVKAVVEKEAPDVIVLAGDMLGHPGDDATVDFFDRLELPGLVVPGNMDHPSLQLKVKATRHLTWIVSRPAIYKDLTFLGVGAERDVQIQPEWDGHELRKLVIVSHRPPWGIRDRDFFGRHAGAKGLLSLLDRLTPIVVICGHIHEDAGWDYYGDIPVVNCSLGNAGQGSLIEIKDGRVLQIRMLE